MGQNFLPFHGVAGMLGASAHPSMTLGLLLTLTIVTDAAVNLGVQVAPRDPAFS
jgi:hypothetical protein